uniref:Demethylmenaquinone methyltransferase n=1 Tax=Fundidesulfovibrio putealis TaxID=270496 RepID=A0A7C4AGH0_9BACT
MRDTQVRKLFDTVARGYDMQNSVLSLGIDILWRKTLAERLPAGRPILVLDAACGTAEVCMEILRRRPLARVLGADFSPGMLAVGREKALRRGLIADSAGHEATRSGQRLHLVAADARNLPLPDACCDAVTIAFGIRNIEKRALALREFRRVLKPGGQLLVMEFSLPSNPVLRTLYRLYFDHVLPPFGNWLSGTDYAYTYLMTSVHAFPGPEAFCAEIAAAGFSGVGQTPLCAGVARIHHGITS